MPSFRKLALASFFICRHFDEVEDMPRFVYRYFPRRQAKRSLIGEISYAELNADEGGKCYAFS